MDKSSLSTGPKPTVSGSAAEYARPADTSPHSPAQRLVIFSIEGQRYALHLSIVERILRMVEVSPLPQAPAIVLGVINFHGQVIPVLDLQCRFGHSSNIYGLSSCLLVAQTSRRRLALPVHEVLGVQEVAAETVTLPDAVFPRIGLVAGIVALSDGLLFIHDLDTFLSLDEERRLTEALEGRTE